MSLSFSVLAPRTGLGDACARILATVPEWFGIPEANAHYVAQVNDSPTWSAVDGGGRVIGLLTLERHFPETAEIAFMAVDRPHHGRGVGTALVTAAAEAARRDGALLLEVKTLGDSHPDPGYALTRRFYRSNGFLPVEETDLWGPDNPALIMVRPLTD